MNMLTRDKISVTAILLMAVLFLGTMLSGCATPRHIEELRAEIKVVQRQNQQTATTLTSLDTLVVQESDNNRKLRADVSLTVDQLEEQIATLQESYQDMLQKIDAIYRAVHERHVLYGSPGSQQEPSIQTPTEPPEAPGVSSIDCSASYDDAFIMVRQGEYEKAIEAFQTFIQNCERKNLVKIATY